MKALSLGYLAGLLFAAGPLLAQHIDIRVSVKVIVNPTNGTPPVGISDSVFYTAASNANLWMDTYYRGYHYRITEVAYIGGPTQGGTNGPSQWFEQFTERNTNPVVQAAWRAMTQTNPLYLLRSDQVNAYVSTDYVPDCGCNNGSGGGSPIPPGDLYTACEIFADDGPWWVVHELGHFFGLQHTFAGENPATCATGSSGLADTLPDSTCWTNEDQMAQNSFGAPYSALTASQQTLVDNTWFNVMSYRYPTNKNHVVNRLTELQLDTEADIANTYRSSFVSGHTLFVSPTGSDSSCNGSSICPLATITNAVRAANPAGGDILLVRPGNYDELFTLNSPVTLRASRVGPVTIGRP